MLIAISVLCDLSTFGNYAAYVLVLLLLLSGPFPCVRLSMVGWLRVHLCSRCLSVPWGRRPKNRAPNLGNKKQRVVRVVMDLWLATAGLRGGYTGGEQFYLLRQPPSPPLCLRCSPGSCTS